MKKALVISLFSMVPWMGLANPFSDLEADIVLLGEVHDNPAHHEVQAAVIEALAPSAIVFEMLTEEQALRIGDGDMPGSAELGEALDWGESGWPDFDMYYPVFVAAWGAEVFGAAVPREETRNAMKIGVPRAFGAEAETYGLTNELEAEELADRLNLQMAAHCNALPLELLPGMVDVQRLRDAELARVALDAVSVTGGPVVVITGNGHARKDWGVPSYLARVAPDVSVFSLGQSEDGSAPDGGFDLVVDAPGVDRADPCDAFR